MKIQYLNGGLANQVFQYIFVRYAELSDPSHSLWFFDDSFFDVNNVHNGLELEKVFGLQLNLLSRKFEPEIWHEFIKNKRNGISVPQSFKNLGFPMVMITEYENYREHNPFDGEVYHVPGNTFLPEIVKIDLQYIYYHGYWLNRGWFDTYRDIFKNELRFPLITDDKNLQYQDKIMKSESLAVHIRRGDYVTIGWASQDEYYRSEINKILSIRPNAVLFVFSDDIVWCKENKESLGLTRPKETIYIEGNIKGNNYIDLQLMCMCKYMIIGKSAFGYLAMLMNDGLQYCVFDQ